MLESYAFLPVDPEKDEEEWPQMELTDANVFSNKRTSSGLEDLLDVQDRGPFRVEGVLSQLPRSLESIIRTKKTDKIYKEPLVVTQVMMYSIQQFDDGAVKIWALGKCGWYSITPSREYEPIFRRMVQKGKLWGFLQDKYEGYSGKGYKIKGTVEELYADYAKHDRKIPNALAASHLFEEHYRYLLFEMCGVRRDTDKWMRTPIFRYFAFKNSTELKAIRRSMACTRDRIGNPASVERQSSLTPPPSTSPAPDVSASPSPKKPKVHNRSNSYMLFKLFFEHVEEQKLSLAEITKKRIIDFVNKSFVFESYQQATINVEARAEGFLSLMENPPPVMVYNWTETPAYKELGCVRTTENDAAVRLQKLTPRVLEQVDNNEVAKSRGARERVFIRSPVKPPVAGKGKSPARVPARIQTPSSSKILDTDPEEAIEDTPAAVALKQKRVLDDFLSPQNGIHSSKRPRTTAAAAIIDSFARSTSLSSLPSTTSSTTITTSPKPSTSRPPRSASRPQGTRANRPGGHWECEISGCNYTIPDADTAEGLQLVEQHYAEHAKVIKQAMDAIGGGEILPSRPQHVDNLLAKIEQMAKKWAISKPTPLVPLELGLTASAPTASGSSGAN